MMIMGSLFTLMIAAGAQPFRTASRKIPGALVEARP